MSSLSPLTSLEKLQSLVNHAVFHLDPPLPKTLSTSDVALKVYDVLIEQVVALSEQEFLHPRVQSIPTILQRQPQENQLWCQVLADALRALLIASVILLELCPRQEHLDSNNSRDLTPSRDIMLDCEACQILERTVQRCLVLLRLLALTFEMNNQKTSASGNGEQESWSWLHTSPPCQYPSLRSALGEIPIEWLGKNLDESRQIKSSGTIHGDRGDSTHDDEEEEEGNALVFSKEQLALEEEELIEMANKPIPFESTMNPFARQGLFLQIAEEKNCADRQVMARLSRYGMLYLEPVVTKATAIKTQSKNFADIYSLSAHSTCCVTTTTSRGTADTCLVFENVWSLLTRQPSVLRLIVPGGLLEGHAWVKVCNFTVTNAMVPHESLQMEISDHWGCREYSVCQVRRQAMCITRLRASCSGMHVLDTLDHN